MIFKIFILLGAISCLAIVAYLGFMDGNRGY